MNTAPRSSLQAAASSDPSSSSNSNHNAAISSASSKKKLGQNLSKLTKPPAPPIPSGAKSNASSRNGLLLLSTKRASSTGNNVASVTTTVGGGILSGKAASLSTAAASSTVAASSNASTNDVLFQAAVGRMEAQQLQLQQLHQPDAWGVAASTDKQSPKNHVNNSSFDEPYHPDYSSESKHPEPVLAPQGGVSYHGSQLARTQENHNNQTKYSDGGPSKFDQPVGSSSRYDSDGRQFSGVNGHRHYDEYSRGRPVSDPVDGKRFHDKPSVNHVPLKLSPVEDQSAFIRERAEARRAEEEARTSEQKERAAIRLRELEEKMAKNAEKAPVLETGHNNGRSQQQSWISPDRSQQRTLFEPNAVTYSALLGGGSKENGEKLASDQDVRAGGPSPPVRKPEPGHENGINQQGGPVIHLSSYEDRDRGERGTTAGPRMLFDPKSGSMVAVPVRDDGGRGRKERPKRIRNDRESQAVTVLKKPEPTSDADYDSTTDRNQRRTSRNRKEDSWHQRSKGRSDSADTPVRAETKKKQGNARKNSERTLPRTCGVLYARDESGNCYPVDGCDGDLGYGAYSVPGGPTKNPDAYAKFLEKHQNYRHDVPDDVVDDYLCDNEPYNSQHELAVTLQTGFKIAEPAPAPKIIDWVKPNEKIELVTGVDDSPTLQATAREWAPSRAALAAAAAVAASGTTPTAAATSASKETKPVVSPAVPLVTPVAVKTSVVVVEEDVQEEEDVPFLGLGFDPTETMDSVIQSPSVRSQKTGGFDVDLAAISLEPPMNATSRNIFAFGSSATWGDSGDNGNAGWDHGFLSSRFSKEGKDVVAASFLSLSDKGWGGTGVMGLGGGALSGKPADTTGE